jgi:hypothetical protein
VRTTLLVLFLSALSPLASAKDPNKEPDRKPKSPFQTITVNDDTIVATLPPDFRRWVAIDNGGLRLTRPGEALSIRAGQVLHMGADNAGWVYAFKPRFQPTAGLEVTCTYDTTTVGFGWSNPKGGIKRTETFFVRAK